MTDRQINKWLRRQFSTIGWILIGYFLLMNVVVTAVAGIDCLKQALWNIANGVFPLDFDMDAVYSNAWGYAVSIGVGITVLYAWKGRNYWKQELFAKGRKMRLSVFLVTMILLMGAQMANSIWMTLVELVMNAFGSSVMPLLESVSGASSGFGMVLYSVLLAPLSEEILFRGYVLRTLRPYGKRLAIFGSALLFGLFHGNILQGPYAFLAGLILGWLTVEYSLNWAIALHIFNNLILAEGLTRLMEVLPLETADLLSGGLFLGAFLLSGVILLGKRREIRAYNQSEWMDRRCLKCFFTNWGMMVFMGIMLMSMVAWLIA